MEEDDHWIQYKLSLGLPANATVQEVARRVDILEEADKIYVRPLLKELEQLGEELWGHLQDRYLDQQDTTQTTKLFNNNRWEIENTRWRFVESDTFIDSDVNDSFSSDVRNRLMKPIKEIKKWLEYIHGKYTKPSSGILPTFPKPALHQRQPPFVDDLASMMPQEVPTRRGRKSKNKGKQRQYMGKLYGGVSKGTGRRRKR